jgi:nucleoid-associated protein YgaU
MVAGTLVLVALAYLTLKKTGASSSSGTAAVPGSTAATGAEGGGTPATTASGNQSYFDSINGQLANLTSAIANLKPSTTSPVVTPPVKTPGVTVPLINPSITNAGSTKKKNGGINTGNGASTTQTHYSVKKGDTLSSIAKQFGTSWQSIYAANKTTIDTTAKSHGYTSNLQNWIFPGESVTVAKKTVNKPATTKPTVTVTPLKAPAGTVKAK